MQALRSMSYNGGVHAVSVGKTVLEGITFFGCGIERIDEFELHTPGKLTPLAGAGDHLMRNLLGRRHDKVVRF